MVADLRWQPGSVVVHIPLAGSEGNGFVGLRCRPWPQGQQRFSCASEDFAEDVAAIGAEGRAGRYETDDSCDAPVRIEFSDSGFRGDSYGLALLLADKLTRYALDSEPVRRRIIYATGRVADAGGGQILGVGEALAGGRYTSPGNFTAKLDLLERQGLAGSVFVFPQRDYDECIATDPKRYEQLQRLERERRIECRPITHIDDLIDWFPSARRNTQSTAPPQTKVSPPPQPQPPRLWPYAVLGLLLGALSYVLL